MMCDTMVATSEVTKDGVTIFGKNSDREPNEGHQLVGVPAADHPAGGRLKCTYLEIPQAAHTFAVLLCKPFWMWGAEMGVNEHQVVIGNEALFTKVPYAKAGLLGMDLLRLGLERGRTARAALDAITGLLAEHGQGGNCGLAHETYYHNSYIIADPQEAWVLETAGPQWAARRIKGIYTISNGITITTDWDLASPGLVDYAVERGWCKGRDDFSFARCYSDFLYTTFSDCHKRRERSMKMLSAKSGRITVTDMMSALRDHGEADGRQDSPDEGLMGADLCMHASFGPVRISQTTGSLVSYLAPGGAAHFVTGTAAPCTSIFKPVWPDVPLPDTGPAPSGKFDPQSLFWSHELLHRMTLRDYDRLLALYESGRDSLEGEFVTKGIQAGAEGASTRAKVSAVSFAQAKSAEAEWLARLRADSKTPGEAWLHEVAWKDFNREANIPPQALSDHS
jgi:dipeptidase